jgi:hypothetical protein
MQRLIGAVISPAKFLGQTCWKTFKIVVNAAFLGWLGGGDKQATPRKNLF